MKLITFLFSVTIFFASCDSCDSTRNEIKDLEKSTSQCNCPIGNIAIEDSKIKNTTKGNLDSLATGLDIELPVLKKWVSVGGELSYAQKNGIVEELQSIEISKFNGYEKEILFQKLFKNASCSQYVNLCNREGKKSEKLDIIIFEYSEAIKDLSLRMIGMINDDKQPPTTIIKEVIISNPSVSEVEEKKEELHEITLHTEDAGDIDFLTVDNKKVIHRVEGRKIIFSIPKNKEYSVTYNNKSVRKGYFNGEKTIETEMNLR
jgi:hypothetical protein